MLTPEFVLQHIAGLPLRRATLKQLTRELKVRGGQRQALARLLAELVRSKRLSEKRRVFALTAAAPAAPAQRGKAGVAAAVPAGLPADADLVGRISLHRDGFAFVIPAVAVPGIGTDIFIPPPAVGNAMHGDTVAVRIVRRHGDGRAEGRVVRIEKRAHSTVVGIFHRKPSGNYVQPIDDRLREPILIPPGQEVPLTAAAATPDRVLGTEAVAAARRPAGVLEGLAVDVEMTAYPTATTGGRGRVIEVLGHRDDFGVDVEIMIRKHHIPHRFPAEVLAEAEAIPVAIPPGEIARRRDFRALPIVTIDGESARDFDDAVLVARLPGGGYELQVHIADVAYYVAPGSAIDLEARLRGTSVYFPDRAVPMLPAQLSTNLCSLRPREDRLVMSCLMRLDASGKVIGYELVEGVICSAARMTYTQVNAVLTGDAAARRAFAPLVEGFELMAELQAVLYKKRQARGSIDFDLPEPEIAFDEFGLMQSIVKSERNIAHRLIEEFMLSAAETVAQHMEAAQVPSVYRIHEQPELKKVAEFEQVAAGFGYSLGVGPLPIKVIRERVGGRVREIEVPQPEKFRISPKHYQKLAARLAGKPEERILSFLMLRSLKQARYSADNVGHFALATACYTHFTSPIRRYPDLMLHRILKSNLDAARPLATELRQTATLEPMCREASESERRSDDAERELMDWKKVRFMEKRLGEEMPALILHVTRQGFFIELETMFIEGFVPAASLADDEYRFLEPSREWVGTHSQRRYKLGDHVQVIVDRIDPVRQQIHFVPVTAAAAPPPRRRRRSAAPSRR